MCEEGAEGRCSAPWTANSVFARSGCRGWYSLPSSGSGVGVCPGQTPLLPPTLGCPLVTRGREMRCFSSLSQRWANHREGDLLFRYSCWGLEALHLSSSHFSSLPCKAGWPNPGGLGRAGIIAPDHP